MQSISPVLGEEFQPKEIILAKDQPEYKKLPALRNRDGVFLSRWKFSDAERAAIAAGADLFLAVWAGSTFPPLMLEIGECDRPITG